MVGEGQLPPSGVPLPCTGTIQTSSGVGQTGCSMIVDSLTHVLAAGDCNCPLIKHEPERALRPVQQGPLG
jgi:hypothetical protein